HHHMKKARNPLLPSRQKRVLSWSEWRDLQAFFACGGREKSKNSPVCALAHAQATGLCGHDSNPAPLDKSTTPAQKAGVLLLWLKIAFLTK
ncbi:MAG: hypothetical protein IIT86_03200, partial [Oscillospiraceae bacterium]|nr:hypothetical protein [Oscillospiraceae bacterium]